MPVFAVYDNSSPRRFEIDAPKITFGRTSDNDVIISDGRCSRRHCEIVLSEVGAILHDLESRNGTLLNDSQIDRPVSLRDGDEIGIGNATVRFWSVEAKIDPADKKLPLTARPAQKTKPRTPSPRPAGKLIPPSADRGPAQSHRRGRDKSPAPAADDAAEIRLIEAGPLPAIMQDVSGPLTIDRIIPLTHENKPAHPTGKGAAQLSEAMLKLKGLMLKGFQFTATDIHIEPKDQQAIVRYRIDGYLHQSGEMALEVTKPLYSIIKLLCNLDINKRNVMQDGSFAIQLPDRRVDLRVSIAPSTRGDKMVMRILDKNLAPQSLDQLGMEAYILEEVRKRAFSESSMLVVCGPTGSGKTTTVYAIIQEINSEHRNIVTVEDPVEYKLPDITQIEVNPKFDITFVSALASLLRQDPDVILIGEMRDRETAQMAVQSAMTGHLVLSTVHARDSIGSIFRLLDLGVEPFVLGSALSAVLSQRLMRQVCPYCKMKFKPPVKELSRLSLDALSGQDMYAAVGCQECMNIGHKGRVAIFEMLAVNDQVRDAIAHRPTIAELRIAAGDWVFQTLREDAIRKLRQGLSTLDEFKAICG